MLFITLCGTAHVIASISPSIVLLLRPESNKGLDITQVYVLLATCNFAPAVHQGCLSDVQTQLR